MIENASLRESLYNMHKHLMAMLNKQQVCLVTSAQLYSHTDASLPIRILKK